MDQAEVDKLKTCPLPFSSPLPEKIVAEILSKELSETEEKIREGIAELKRFIHKNNIPTYENEDFLLKFLRTKKFRLSDCTSTLENFTKSLKELHNKMGTIDAESILEVKKDFQKNVHGILPYRDRYGRPTIHFRFGMHQKEGIQPIILPKAGATLMSMLIQDTSSQLVGVNWIVDCEMIGLRDVYESLEFGFIFSKFLLRLPIRIKRFDVLHENFLSRVIYNALKHFFSKKMRDRIHFHGDNLEKFIEYYGSSTLPNEFGGTGGELCNDHWAEDIDKAVEMFNQLTERAMT